ncbi:MAG: urease accessory protein UreD [Rhodobacteraceae bacterium HLUCCA12]|nr:MAG: urease accessory protein UreD [Rhodobacteraceae bacterium HLUCCA12]
MTLHAPIQQRAQRSHGRTILRLDGGERVIELHQSGCSKLFLLRGHGAPREAVFVNTAGGLTGGDTLHARVALGSGAALACTTQAAERIYRSAGGAACVSTELELGRGATLASLPQETILFDASRLERRLRVEMAEDAKLVLVEMLTLGRAAMGERAISAAVNDGRMIRRGGRLITHDVQRLTLPLPADPALLGDGTALATMMVVAPDAEDRAVRLRAALSSDGVEAALSAWDGRLVARLLSPAPHLLRRALARGLHAISPHNLPRTWAIQQEETA